MTCQSQVLPGASDFSEKFVIHWSSPTCPYPSPLLPSTPYHLSFPLSSKQTPVATIKNKYNNTTFSFHRCRPFLHPLQAKIPKALATLSPLPHFSLTLSPLQAEHPLQMFQQSHQCPPRYSILCALLSLVLLHLSAAFNTIYHSRFGTLFSFRFQNSTFS